MTSPDASAPLSGEELERYNLITVSVGMESFDVLRPEPDGAWVLYDEAVRFLAALTAQRDEARRCAESKRDDEESANHAIADMTRLPLPKRTVFPWESPASPSSEGKE